MAHEKIIITIDDDYILELIPDYLTGRRDEVKVLLDAATQKDFATLQSLGHQMKGTGGGYGFDHITVIGGQLESGAKAQDLPAIEQEIADLRDYLERVEVVGK